jgi:hypothetical protein
MRELAPRHEQWWFDVYGRVARTGEPTRFESLASSLGPRWFDVFACRVGEPDDAMVAIMFSDITTSKQAQDALNSAELAAAADLAVMTRLQAVATRLLGPGELDSMLAELLATSAELLCTGKGNIQCYDAERQQPGFVRRPRWPLRTGARAAARCAGAKPATQPRCRAPCHGRSAAPAPIAAKPAG